MRLLRTRCVVLVCLLSTLLVACGDDGPTSLEELPEDLIVTWFATSLVVNGTELMDDGMRLRLTFASDGSYRFDATRDRTGFICEGELDCVMEGTFDASPSEVVFEPEADPTRLAATLTPTSLSLLGTSDGMSLNLTFVLPPYPDLIGTWMATSLSDEDGEIQGGGGARTTLVMTFEADGSYAYASTFSPPDLFCDPATSCLGDGAYVTELDELTFDPGSRGALTMQLSVDPAQLMLLGDVDGAFHDWTFSKLEVASPGIEGRWRAVSLRYRDSPMADSTVHELQFQGTFYSSYTIADTPGPFLCGPDNVAPECVSGGIFVADLDALEFVDGLATSPQSVSIETTPTSLRITGAVDGEAADFLYARVPPS